MKIQFTCPYWGQEGTTPSMFFTKVLRDDYDGVEINLPDAGDFIASFLSVLDDVRSTKIDFVFTAQHVPPAIRESVDDHIRHVKSRLEYLVSLRPDFINSHTGKDYYSFDDNCRIIDVVENIAHRSGIPILHETHRGRFAFHAATLLPYLEKFPQLRLTADFSHWCTVSESMLADQQDNLTSIIPHVNLIHARIGHEHAPQVNDPFAPEWDAHFKIFLAWWREIIDLNRASGKDRFIITPEFGPVPYMPTEPYSRKPLTDQWMVNVKIKNVLKQKLETTNVAG